MGEALSQSDGPGQDSEIEIRQVFEAADFGPRRSRPSSAQREERLRAQVRAKHPER